MQIGEWVLRHACRQAQEWRKRLSDPLPIAVNL
jgi:EAL domain-containing protein (putative c-di-GMP-specific phosphodiesterase class I)